MIQSVSRELRVAPKYSHSYNLREFHPLSGAEQTSKDTCAPAASSLTLPLRYLKTDSYIVLWFLWFPGPRTNSTIYTVSFLSSNHLLAVSCLWKQLEAGIQSCLAAFLQDLSTGSSAPGLALLLQQGLVWAERTCLTHQQYHQISYALMRLQQRASPHKPVNIRGPVSGATYHITLVWYWLVAGELCWMVDTSWTSYWSEQKTQPFSRKEWNKIFKAGFVLISWSTYLH